MRRWQHQVSVIWYYFSTIFTNFGERSLGATLVGCSWQCLCWKYCSKFVNLLSKVKTFGPVFTSRTIATMLRACHVSLWEVLLLFEGLCHGPYVVCWCRSWRPCCVEARLDMIFIMYFFLFFCCVHLSCVEAGGNLSVIVSFWYNWLRLIKLPFPKKKKRTVAPSASNGL